MFNLNILKHRAPTAKASRASRSNLQKGFSLPELIIVIAIFAIITTVALFNQGRLSSSILLTNMAYEVGLAVREAQIYGIGVRSEDEGANFTGQYGVRFQVAPEDWRRQVVVYADNPDPLSGELNSYDPGEEKYIYEFNNRRGNKILALCVGDLGGGPCTDGIGYSTLDILFKRPNPSAIVKLPEQLPTSDRAYIVVTNIDEDDCRVVVVEPTGQIRVEDSTKGACEAAGQ